MKKILLTGSTGQLGSALLKTLRCAPVDFDIIATTRRELDLSHPESIRRAVRDMRPDCILNAAAFNAVDRAEREPQTAKQINADAVEILAEEAKKLDAMLIHFSTNYVFDGKKKMPYVETNAPNPLSAYAESKLEGERAVQEIAPAYLIFRTSWIYSDGADNFVSKIRRAGRGREKLEIVDDQFGTPNSACGLAEILNALLKTPMETLKAKSGVYHLSAKGETSWFQFAKKIFETFPEDAPQKIIPVSMEKYSKRVENYAARPKHAVLSSARFEKTFNIRMRDWKEMYNVQCTMYK